MTEYRAEMPVENLFLVKWYKRYKICIKNEVQKVCYRFVIIEKRICENVQKISVENVQSVQKILKNATKD